VLHNSALLVITALPQAVLHWLLSQNCLLAAASMTTASVLQRLF